MVRAAIIRPRLGQISVTDKLDKFAVHPLWGLLLLCAIFGLVFWLTFSVALPIQNWLDVNIVGFLQTWFKNSLSTSPSWLRDLIVHGVLGGAGIVITFVPILIVFFTLLALLEDSGYLVRAAYVMDRFMHVLGLHGKSFLPLFLGFGCNVPAVMGTRVIESESGRLLTILLAPLVPCSARLMVLALLAPAFFGEQALFFSWVLVMLNILVLTLLGIVLNRTLFRGQHVAFIMELPLYHKPSSRAVALFVWQNTREFLRKAGTIILLMSMVVWALSEFPGAGIEQSYLAQLGHSLEPLGQLMGMDWRMIVALLSSFIAKENAIATLAILFRSEEDTAGLVEMMASTISPATALAFLVVTMLFIPCVATVAAMYQETRSWRWTIFSVVLLLATAVSAGIVVFQVTRLLNFGA
jgi:ferrous iron transport protein B